MARADVEQRKDAVKSDFETYLTVRKGEIDAKSRTIAEVGVANAATEPERLSNARQATVAEGVFLEQTVGADDKAPINFLELGMRAARAVCHIVDGNRTSLGSGFLVGPGVVITNNHVLASSDEAEGAIAEFMFERDAEENALTPARFGLEPTRLFVTSPQNKLDFSFVAVAGTGLAGERLEAQSWLPMDARRNKILDGQPVVIIQHPNGQLKTICLFDSVCRFRDPDPAHPFLLYTTDTDFGSSGSPAFNRFWQLIALHHAATADRDPVTGSLQTMNRGIRISSIIAALAEGPVPGVVVGSADQVRRLHTLLLDPQTQKKGRPFAPSVTPAATPAPVALTPEARPTVVRRRPDGHFDGRKGYDQAFLAPAGAAPAVRKRLTVRLPKLPEWLLSDVAHLKNRADDYELKYQHFSIVMSRSRGLSLLTACNIDGARLLKLPRKDRDPDAPLNPDIVPEAAADMWFYDPRLEERHQLGPELLDRTSFDFGHLVRRLDPVWAEQGDLRTPRIANDDTFCMTNCSPQEVSFHRQREDGDGNWSALEDVILNEVNLKDIRASVFTGPVLDPRDPTILGVKVPTAFWKIVAYADDDRLKAHGFMLWQDEEVAELDARFERTLNLRAARRPVAIREIGRLTGLDFGPLFEADVRG